MARTNSIQQNRIDPTRPFFAAVGSVDVAVHYARTGLTEAQTRLAKVDFEPKALAGTVQREAKAIPSRVSNRVEAKVSEYVSELSETVDDLNQQYVDLAARGRTLVNRIRGQQATQDLKAEAKKTTTRVKTTRTQAGRTADQATASAKKTATSVKRTARATGDSAKTVKSSAKASGTSARKTATAAKKATQDAAAKTGA